jgi:TonB family protein
MKRRAGAALAIGAALVALATCAMRAAADSTLPIPGSALSLGMRLTHVDSLVAFRIAGQPAAPNRRNGLTRFFGLDAATTLDFEGGRLMHAHFEVKDVSTHSRDYVEDQLARSGMKPAWDRRDAEHHEGDWNGASVLHLIWDPGTLTADAHPPPGWSAADSLAATRAAASAPESAAAAGAASAPASIPGLAPSKPVLSSSGSSATPAGPPASGSEASEAAIAAAGMAGATSAGGAALAMLPDTLYIGWPDDVSQAHRARTLVPPAKPTYPDAARRAGVMGVVRLIATVDPRGVVSNTEIVHSIPELDRAAASAVRACRFVPLGPPGMPEGFRVLAQVRFTP